MKRTWLIILIVVLAVAATLFFVLRSGNGSKQKFRTATVTRGTITATVTSTGTIVAVGTVEVGTQVSGTIEEVLVDYNDTVRKGQLLARLDTRVLQAAVDDANANLDRTQAQYAAALDQYDRNKALFDKKYISAIEFNQYRTNLDAARASVVSARVALQRAKTNFGYAEIRSPTDGTVIGRSVEPGQTVAASLSTPTLFTIANDLSHMQIEANVDESDIGQIEEGQRVTFTVQSHSDRTYSGVVNQIRLQPQTIQNVVNYTVVVDASNQDGTLLPGMTATVNFEVKRVTDVLVVPNAALRFQPSSQVLEEIRARAAADSGTTVDTAGSRRSRAGGDTTGGVSRFDTTARSRTGGASRTGGSRSQGRLWTLDSAGSIRMAPIRVGVSDGQQTEVMGRNVHEGMVVITGVEQAETNNSNPGGVLPFGQPSGPRGTRSRGF